MIPASNFKEKMIVFKLFKLKKRFEPCSNTSTIQPQTSANNLTFSNFLFGFLFCRNEKNENNMAQVTSQAHDLQDRCLLRWRYFHALRLELRHGHGVRADVTGRSTGVCGVHVGDVQLEARLRILPLDSFRDIITSSFEKKILFLMCKHLSSIISAVILLKHWSDLNLNQFLFFHTTNVVVVLFYSDLFIRSSTNWSHRHLKRCIVCTLYI